MVWGAVNSTNSAENAGGISGGSGSNAFNGMQLDNRITSGTQHLDKDVLRRWGIERRSKGEASQR